MISNKPHRNDPCPCGSGLKYKYCYISKDLKERKITIEICKCKNCGATYTANMDFTKDPLNVIATTNIPIMNFCKDNNLYFLCGSFTMGDYEEIQNKLKNNTLETEDILNVYKKHFNKKDVWAIRLCH